MRTTRLTGLLHELEGILDDLGSPFSSYAAPGLDDDQIDELLAPSGRVVPTELREWWRWHHGYLPDLPYGVDPYTLGARDWGLMDIPWALRDAAEWAADVMPEGDWSADEWPDDDWQPDWLPFAFSNDYHGRLVARLGGSTSDEVCVGWWYVFDVPPDEPVAHSLAEVVENIIRLLRSGHVAWNPSGVGCWERGPRRMGLPYYLGS